MSLSRYLAPAVLATSLGLAAFAAPVQAQSEDMIRVLVGAADVAMRGNTPYYRQGNYGYNDRLIAQRDQYGRVVYYRTVPRAQYYGNNQYYGNSPYYGNSRYQQNSQPPYGNAYGYYRNAPVTGNRSVKCNKNGKCTTKYYDPRYDRDGRYGNNNARYDRRWDDRRDRDDD